MEILLRGGQIRQRVRLFNLISIDIAWYRGDVRSYNFVVSVSIDGANFKDIVSASSTGQITSLEKYNIPDLMARYVRVPHN
jgi:hypothetical protein